VFLSTAGAAVTPFVDTDTPNGLSYLPSTGTVTASRFQGRAAQAEYADLAEMYLSDADYPPGTVLEFGGETEVTATTQTHSTRVAGIVSTQPAYTMNYKLEGKHVVAVGLTGRVPCMVIGKIIKGDRLVASNIKGVATVLDMNHYEPGCIVGKALEDYDSDQVGTITVAVGKN
jgi:hypothetical protein